MTERTLNLLARSLRQAAGAGGPAPTDRQLLERFVARREEEAFAELVRRHGPMVLSVCRRALGNRERPCSMPISRS